MSFLDKFEHGSEEVFNKIFSHFGSKDLKPVELVSELKKEVDSKVISVSGDTKVAPSEYHIVLSTADFDTVESWGSHSFADELALEITQYSKAEGYSFSAPVVVVFEENMDFEKGVFTVSSKEPSSDLASVSKNPQAKYTIDVNGMRYTLEKNLTTLGRSADADIVIDDTSVSRKHIQFEVTLDGVIVKDLGSTNGMRVEDHLTADALLLNGNTISIGRSKIVFWQK